MHTRTRFRTSMLAVAALTLSACSLPKTQPARPDQATAIPAQWQEAIPQQSGSLSQQLLSLIDEPQLSALVEQTLSANYDLHQTALRLQEQRLLSQQSSSQTLPTLDLKLSSQRARNTTGSHALSLDLSWEADIWGRLADQARADQLTTDAQAVEYQAAQNSLAARTIQRWLDLTLRQQIIAAERQWLQSLEDTEAVIRERYRYGLSGNSALADLETARADTALIRASLAAREQAQRDAWRQLAALQGKPGSLALSLPRQVPMLSNPPVQLPAAMVANRPDLQAALIKVAAADAQALVRHKQLLPGFSLSASLSQTRPRLDELLSGSTVWSLLGELTAPLFDGGRRKASADIADLAAARSYLAYQQALLNALNEVETALGQEASLAEQQRQLSAALQHADASLQHYQARYRDGVGDILDLLNARKNAFSTRIQLLQTQQARLTNRITLGLALGMGV